MRPLAFAGIMMLLSAAGLVVSFFSLAAIISAWEHVTIIWFGAYLTIVILLISGGLMCLIANGIRIIYDNWKEELKR